jgi:hypothetical protein
MKRQQASNKGVPHTVPCPLRIQKKILKNPVLAARSKIAPLRRKRAAEILSATRKQARQPPVSESSSSPKENRRGPSDSEVTLLMKSVPLSINGQSSGEER